MSGPDSRLRELLETAAGQPPRSVTVPQVRRLVRRRRVVHGAVVMSAAAAVTAIGVGVALAGGQALVHGRPANGAVTIPPEAASRASTSSSRSSPGSENLPPR
jgi:hypothetical protein